MPLESQPPDRRGTVGRPYSALNLRFALAAFGLVACAVVAALLVWADQPVLAVIFAVLAIVALVDLVVIQARRRRTDPGSHSLFE